MGSADVTLEATLSSTSWADPGASAADAYDGIVNVTRTEAGVDTHVTGVYTITWSAVDAHGNAGSVTRTITVVDTTPPTVELSDTSDMVLEAVTDAPYVEAATVTATDLAAGVVDVEFTTDVDANAVGTYRSRWTATDAAGNTAAVQRSVLVRDTTPPALLMHGSQLLIVPTVLEGETIESHGPAVPAGHVTAVDLVDGDVPVTVHVRCGRARAGAMVVVCRVA